jgi:virulence factor Mce-like protein
VRPRRLLVLAGVGLAAAAGVAFGAPSGDGDDYRVDVVFDDSRGLVPGQLVQVAGARVGTITDVTLTRDYKARVHLKVDPQFAPFREDAECTIKPQGLIAENYVECVPGSPDARPMRGRGDAPPTVPVERTTQPVALTDLFEIWNAPTRDRLQVLLSTLGMATVARGEDLNALLRRANPALARAQETIAVLERQRDDLANAVDATGAIADRLAERPERLSRLVDRAAKVTTETASERAALGAGLQRLPRLLRDARPALQKLDATMDAGEPLLERLEDAAPDVNRVTADVPKLAKVAGPALDRLAPVLRDGAVTARRAAPLLGLVQQYARASLPNAHVAGELFSTLEGRGFPQTFFEFVYNGAVAAARYDESGHILPAHVTFTLCGMYAATPVAGCGSGNEPRERRAKRRSRTDDERRSGGERRDDAGETPPSQTPSTPAPAPAAPAQPAPGPAAPATPPLPAPQLPPLPQPPQVPEDPAGEAGDAGDDLLDFLLR